MKKFYNSPKSIQIVLDFDGLLMDGTATGEGGSFIPGGSNDGPSDQDEEGQARKFTDISEW